MKKLAVLLSCVIFLSSCEIPGADGNIVFTNYSGQTINFVNIVVNPGQWTLDNALQIAVPPRRTVSFKRPPEIYDIYISGANSAWIFRAIKVYSMHDSSISVTD
jgi:hypothetical protein